MRPTAQTVDYNYACGIMPRCLILGIKKAGQSVRPPRRMLGASTTLTAGLPRKANIPDSPRVSHLPRRYLWQTSDMPGRAPKRNKGTRQSKGKLMGLLGLSAFSFSCLRSSVQSSNKNNMGQPHHYSLKAVGGGGACRFGFFVLFRENDR